MGLWSLEVTHTKHLPVLFFSGRGRLVVTLDSFNFHLLLSRIMANPNLLHTLGTYMYAGNRKNGFIVLPSHKIIVIIYSVTHSEVRLGGMRPSWARQMYRVHHSYPPPTRLTIWYAGRAIYTECWGTIPQYTVCCCHSILWHSVLTTSSISFSSSATSSPLFFLPWERICWTFLGCYYASFPTMFLGFLKLFSNSPLSIVGCLLWGPASRMTITRTI